MLTVITGGMFSEKTTELMRRGKRLTRAGKKVAYFKPDFDIRYSADLIMSHDGKSVPAFNLPLKQPHNLFNEEYLDYEVILIDEVQFFPSVIVSIIDILLKQGKTVIVAGLDLDFEAKPFAVTSALMSKAEELIKLKAVCSDCGNDSWVSYKIPNGKRIELGTNEYKPLCRQCFYNKQLEDEK